MVSFPYQALKLSEAFQSCLENEALFLIKASSKRATCSKIGNNYYIKTKIFYLLRNFKNA